MLSLLFQGIFFGLTIAILLGPAFFTLIQTSIHRGFRSGLFLAIGIFCSDLALVYLSFLGASQIFTNKYYNLYFGIIGSLILIIFGIVTFITVPKTYNNNNNNNEKEQSNKAPGPLTFILKGFFLNIANPMIIMFWVSIVTTIVVAAEPEEKYNHFITFFSGTLITIFSTDILKCFIANKIKQYLKPNYLVIINHILGVILIVFGIILIYRVYLGNFR